MYPHPDVNDSFREYHILTEQCLRMSILGQHAAYHNTMVVPNRNFILESWIPGIPVPDMFLSIGMPACRLEGAWLMPPTITRRIKRELLQCHSSLFFTTHRKRIAVSTVEPRLKGLLPYSFKSHGLSSTNSGKKMK